MKLSFKTLERDLGLKRLRAAFEAARKPYVKVGLLGGAKDRRPGEPIGNVELGMVHELGSPSRGIPQRSFIRAPFHAQRGEYMRMLRTLISATLRRKAFEPRQALALVGERMAADFKRAAPGTPPPNAPETLRRKLAKTRPGSKGSPQTLVDTGRMVDSISYEVTVE